MFVVVEDLLASFLMMNFVGWGEFVGLSVRSLFSNAVPNGIDYFFVIKTFEDAITTYKEKVKVVLEFEDLQLRLTNNNIGVTAVPSTLGFDVTKSP